MPVAVAVSVCVAAAAQAGSPLAPGPGSSDGKQTKQPATVGFGGTVQGRGGSAASACCAAMSASAVVGHSATEQRGGQARRADALCVLAHPPIVPVSG